MERKEKKRKEKFKSEEDGVIEDHGRTLAKRGADAKNWAIDSICLFEELLAQKNAEIAAMQ